MRVVIIIIAAALLVAGCVATPAGPETPGDGPLAPLAWLTGAWETTAQRGPRTEEHWIAPDGGTMLGMNRTIIGGRTGFFEFLRLEAVDDVVVYHAAPLGRHPATPFRLVEVGPGRAVFENPDHDFPQRIVYRREGTDGLVQRIEGVQDGETKSSEWRLRRRP